MRFLVETGSYEQRIEATDGDQAVVFAFKKRPPARPGILTRFACIPLPREWSKYQRRWAYVDTEHFLRKAGYKVKRRPPNATNWRRSGASERNKTYMGTTMMAARFQP